MAKLTEQTLPEMDVATLSEQIGASRRALLLQFLEVVLQTPPTQSQPKTKSADPNEGLDGPYGVNLD